MSQPPAFRSIRRRAPFRRRAPIKKQTTASIAKSNRRALRQMNETQFTAIAGMTNITLTTTPSVSGINFVGPIVGRSYMLKGIELMGDIKANLTSQIQDKWRVDVILDRRPSGTVLSPLLAYASATPQTNVLINKDQRDRYRIIRSWRGIFNTVDFISDHRDLTLFKRFKLKVFSSDDDAVVAQANIQTNALYVVAWTEAVANTPVLDLKVITKGTE